MRGIRITDDWVYDAEKAELHRVLTGEGDKKQFTLSAELADLKNMKSASNVPIGVMRVAQQLRIKFPLDGDAGGEQSSQGIQENTD